MNKLLVCVWFLWGAACQSAPPEIETLTGALSGSVGSNGSGAGSGSGDGCDCPPGTEPRVDDQGQLVCTTPECAVAADCPGGETCVSGSCEPVPCYSDDACADPRVCVQGACIEPACDSCPSGYHCVEGAFPEGDHVCVPDTCDDDSDCRGGLSCINRACVEDPLFCEEDSDCPSGHCSIEIAAPGCASCPEEIGVCERPGGCASDAACPPDEHCEHGVCVGGPGPCASDADCPDGVCDVETGICLDAGGCIDDADCPAGQACLAGTCGVIDPCTSDEVCGGELRCLAGLCTDCRHGDCVSPPPGPDAGAPGPDGGSPGPDAGVPWPDPDTVCPLGCGQRTGYHLSCPTRGTVVPSWCPESPSCGAMDACQASQLDACNAGCPGGCVTTFDGPTSCCDCPVTLPDPLPPVPRPVPLPQDPLPPVSLPHEVQR